MTASKANFLLPILVIASALLLTIGLFAPAITIAPEGNNNLMIRMLSLVFDGASRPVYFSTLGSIRQLFLSGNIVIGTFVLLGASVFPFVRLILFLICWEQRSYRDVSAVVKKIESINKYCLLDVFILSLIIVIFNQIPGPFTARLEWGIFLTAGSVIFSAAIPYMMPTKEMVSEFQ